MEKIYIDLVQTSNFKYHPPIQFTFFPTKISYSINQSKILQKIFSERNFFYGKLDKYPDKRDYPIKGTIERIFHSRSRGLLQKDREKSRPNPRPSWPNIILWNSRTLQELKKKKKIKHLWNGNLWYASKKLMLTSAATTQKSFVATPLRSFLPRCALFRLPFAVTARVS